MRSRKYTKRIEIFTTAAVSDGFGGNTVSEVLLATSWADIRTVRPERLTDLGITDGTHSIEVRLRHRNDLDYEQEGIFFKYRDSSYIFKSVNPINLEDVHVIVIAVKDGS